MRRPQLTKSGRCWRICQYGKNRESTERMQNGRFCNAHGLVSSKKKLRIGQAVPKILVCAQREKTRTCSNPWSQQVVSNNYLAGRHPTRILSPSSLRWKDVRRSVSNVMRIGKQDNRANFQSLHTLCGWPPLQKWRINWRQLENCSKFVHTSSWHACIYHAPAGLTFFYFVWITWQELSQNGIKLVTNAWPY